MASVEKKHPGRKRRIVGWTSLSLAGAAVGVWLASAWFVFGHYGGRLEWRVYWGQATVYAFTKPYRANGAYGWWAPKRELRLDGTATPCLILWDWRWQTSNAGTSSASTQIHFPLWPLPLLLTGAGVPVLRSGLKARRRAQAGACPACGYDLGGLTLGAVCPECGKKTV